jgi:hypothetical protein
MIHMKTLKLFHWLPRIICILAILFVSLFALDAFDPKLTIWQQLGGFLIHLVPSYILIILLVIAWKWELIGGILFMLIAIGLSPFLYIHNYHMNHSLWMTLSVLLMITFPFFLVGVLFLISYNKKKKLPAEPKQDLPPE